MRGDAARSPGGADRPQGYGPDGARERFRRPARRDRRTGVGRPSLMRGRPAPSSRHSTGPSTPCRSVLLGCPRRAIPRCGDQRQARRNGATACGFRTLGPTLGLAHHGRSRRRDHAILGERDCVHDGCAPQRSAARCGRESWEPWSPGASPRRRGSLPSAWHRRAWPGQSRRSMCCSPPSPARLSGLAMPVPRRSRHQTLGRDPDRGSPPRGPQPAHDFRRLAALPRCRRSSSFHKLKADQFDTRESFLYDTLPRRNPFPVDPELRSTDDCLDGLSRGARLPVRRSPRD